MNKNIVLSMGACLVLMACASYGPLDQIPVTKKDFKLPPQALLDKFPDVAAYHERNIDQARHDSGGTIKGNLSELTKKWGFPKKSRKELSSVLTYYGYVPAINALIFWPYFEYIIPVSAIEMIAVGPTRHVIWKKGNYLIDATFSGRKNSHLLGWEWHYVDGKGKQIPLVSPVIKHWFLGLSVSRGYEVIDNDVSPVDMKMARGAEMGIGREIGLWSDSLLLETKIAFKLHGDSISETGQRLMYQRAHWDLGLRYYFSDSKFSSGLAFVFEPAAIYKVNKRSYFAKDIDYKLMNPAVGASFDVQYRQDASTSVFARAEFLKLSSKSTNETIDASNVAMGIRFYF